MSPGWLIAAPSSGAGKTTVTLGILRALTREGVAIAPFKSGPDYIDPRFHEAAAGTVSRNLDAWAMRPERLRELVSRGEGTVIVEAAMGLFDGAADGSGSAADLAKVLGLRVALVVDCAKQAQSVAALVHGFSTFDPSLRIEGVILNRVASDRHEAMLRAALTDTHILGVVRRDARLALPERHLGLVQAEEHGDLEAYLDAGADAVSASIDLGAFSIAAGTRHTANSSLAPLGSRIAVARDAAFAFTYPHLLEDWRMAGAELSFFSPLQDEAPDTNADAVFLPGGYPELYGGRIAGCAAFQSGLHDAAKRGATVYGECGGYMVLGEGLVDEMGNRHQMSGLLPVETSFANCRLQLGYRNLEADHSPFGTGRLKAHEFHYCTLLREEGEPLFYATDATGLALGTAGLRQEKVMGSWMHVIDAA